LAIVYALKRFHTFLDHLPFTIVTDCEALTQTLKKKEVNARIAKWALVLENYNYKVQHRKGEQMQHVDALSRVSVSAAVAPENVDVLIQIAQSRDPNICFIRNKLETEELSNYILENGLVFRKTHEGQKQLLVPEEMEESIMRAVLEQCGHFGIGKCASQIGKNYRFPKMKGKLAKFISNCLKCIYYSASHRKNNRNLYNIPKHSEPFDTVHIDPFLA